MHPSSPSFCYITPTSYLEQYAIASKTHLTLAHLIDKDPTYAQFYATRGQIGDYIMMDNSSYELKTPYLPDKLIELAKKSGANVVVLPDYPFQPAQKTIDAAIEYTQLFKQAGLGTFFVPQSQTGELEDWIRGYVWASNNPDIDVIGMSILGIPNALNNIDPTYARVVMTKLLQDRGLFNFCKRHHYLGLNSGPALEIPSLIRLNALNTIDSSGPVWHAILGHEYTENADSFLQVKKVNSPVDFSIKLSKDLATLNRVQHNINLTRSLFDIHQTESKAWYAQE